MANKVFYDGDFTVARAIGPVRTEEPFDFQPDTHIFRQRFRQLSTHFRRLPNLSPMPGWRDDTTIVVTGNWKINYRAATAVVVAGGANATPDQVKTAFESLSSVGAGKVESVSGSFRDGFSITVIPNSGIQFAQHPVKVNATGLSPAHAAQISRTSNRTQHIDFVLANNQDGGAYLVGESPRQEWRGGMVTWERIYANVPKAFVEYEGFNYQRQTISVVRIPWSGTTDQWGNFHGTYRTFTNLAEWSEPLTAQVAYSFCRGSQLGRGGAQFRIPYRIIHYRDSFGNEVSYQVGQWGVAEPTSARRWLGDIWQVRNTFVQPY